ncbi:hypothetical protein WJ42_20985 [Burkholderia cepacia]|nr:hypothetical protein WJ42_20985 [Burkholderia cepacia]KWC61744.1 hypothetical protein WL55_29970 [Burkholderia cepacia]
MLYVESKQGHDKAGVILRMGNEPITVEAIGRRLESPMPAPGARYRSEVRVEAGDAHSVRITIAPDGMPAWLIAELLQLGDLGVTLKQQRFLSIDVVRQRG